MRFITVTVAVFASLLSVVSAKDPIVFPNAFSAPQPGEVIKAGTDYTVKWDPSPKIEKVKLILRKGKSDDLDNVATLATIKNEGSYKWSVDKSLPSGKDYALQIVDDTNDLEFNHTGQFVILSEVPAAEEEESSSTASASGTSTKTATEESTETGAPSSTMVTSTKSSTATETETSTKTSSTAKPTITESDGAAGALAVKGLGAVAGVMALALFA